MFRISSLVSAIPGAVVAITLIGCDSTQLGTASAENGPSVNPSSLSDYATAHCESIEVDISGTRLRGHSSQNNTTPPVVLSSPIPAGEYQIRLHYDDETHPGQSPQLNEQWYAELYDKDGNSVLMTPPSLDLPDDEIVSFTDVGSHTVAEDVYSLSAVHAYQADTYNSIHPTMVELFPTQCGFADRTSPIITLLGGSHLMVFLNQVFIDPGVQANDQVDGDMSSAVVVGGDTVDTSVFGIYVITYEVIDSSGNKTTVRRTVEVTLSDEGT
ncbi:MAG: DUF5011 domain-containing protein [Pseudomonadota bacterium]